MMSPAIALAANSTAAAGSFASSCINGVFDVLIIGAGWAGMAAADHLVRNAPNVTFSVLESSNYTGGRSHAIEFGRDKEDGGPGRYVIETGSNWISGVPEKKGSSSRAKQTTCTTVDGQCPGNVTQSKILELAEHIGLHISHSADSKGKFDGTIIGNIRSVPMVYDAQGNDGDPDGILRLKHATAVECVAKKVNALKEHQRGDTIRKFLAECDWQPKTDIEWAIDLAATECNGSENDFERADSWVSDSTYEWWGHNDALVIDQHPRGYARLIDEMAKDTIPQGDPRLIFNAHVVNIDYDVGNSFSCYCQPNVGPNEASCISGEQDHELLPPVVKISTRDGRNFYAKEVISTLPVGVLQKHHKSLFTPALPDDFRQVLSTDSGAILMRNVTRIALQFSSAWWDDSVASWVSANAGANDTVAADVFSRWRNLNHRTALPGSNIIFCLMGDPQSTIYEGLPNEKVKSAVMRQLRVQHPNKDIPDPIDFYMSRHGYDDTRYGAFSVFRANWKDEEYAPILRKPVTDLEGTTRIRFAGEAMCIDLSGFTHGAFYSGIGAAAGYLYEHGMGPDPDELEHLDLCNWSMEDDEETDVAASTTAE